MLLIDSVLIFQALLGAFDNLWHHEWQARLPRQRGAARELALHAAREALYGALFLGLAWWAWHGALAFVVIAVLATEVVITLADFLEEDRTRRLPPFERWLHTILTLGYGLFIGLFAPVLHQWAHFPTGLDGANRGWVSWTFTAFAIAVWAWSVRNAVAAFRLSREPRLDAAPIPHGADAVLVTGGTGFLGQALITELRANLRADVRRVIVLTRDARQARGQFDTGVRLIEHLDEIAPETRIAAIVHLAGARVLGRPWTVGRRRQLIESRTRIGSDLLTLIRRLDQRPEVLVAASAVGYYGVPRFDSVCDESAPPMPGVFQSDLCAAIEHEARRAEALGLRVVRLRLGVVLGREDGAYPMQACAARFGLAAVLGDGRQPMPWIHRDDAVGLIRWALEDRAVDGAVNGVSPERTTQRDFVEALAASFGRRARFRMPAAPLRRLAGEMSTLLLDGQSVVPQRALRGRFRFRYPTLDEALRALAKPASAEGAAAASASPAPASTPASPVTASTPSNPATVYFDGECPICSREIELYRKQPGAETLTWVDIARCAPDALGADLSREQALARLHLRKPDGRLVSGADAFTALWRALPKCAWLGRLVGTRPGSLLFDAWYRAFLVVRRKWR